MADTHSPEVRSYNMSRIKSKGTKPEILVRKFLHSNGLRYRLHKKNLPGKPDVVLKKYNTIVLINGCFWHCHSNCKRAVIPKSKEDYWIPKLSRNVVKDKQNIELLQKLGWKVLIIWECQLSKANAENSLKHLLEAIKSPE